MILVTGATGNVGSVVVEQLVEAGLDVRAFTRSPEKVTFSRGVTPFKGDLLDVDALRAAIKRADFKSVRGPFKFNSNGFPVQDFYLVKVAKRADGKFETEIVQKVLTNAADDYAADCPLK